MYQINGRNIVDEYELTPRDRRASFYRKAIVYKLEDGTEALRSYDTIVMTRDTNGVLHRHWDAWSATTGRHIASYCGLGKKDWMKMDVEDISDVLPEGKYRMGPSLTYGYGPYIW